jgi:hypothetical protein
MGGRAGFTGAGGADWQNAGGLAKRIRAKIAGRMENSFETWMLEWLEAGTLAAQKR